MIVVVSLSWSPGYALSEQGTFLVSHYEVASNCPSCDRFIGRLAPLGDMAFPWLDREVQRARLRNL